jgi:hypothetical protein
MAGGLPGKNLPSDGERLNRVIFMMVGTLGDRVGHIAKRAFSPRFYRTLSRIWRSYLTLERKYWQRFKMRSFRNAELLVEDWEKEHPPSGRPVVLMNVSSRIWPVSFNAATELLLGWALRVAGRRVIYYSCRHGLPQCQLGYIWAEPYDPPPCYDCNSLSGFIFPALNRCSWYEWPAGYDADLASWLQELEKLSLNDLKDISFEGLPLGKLVWPSLMWALRLGDPSKDEAASWLMARYIAGAAGLARHFRRFIEGERPQTVAVFNGVTYPEAVVSTIAREQGIPVVTYETGFKEGSIYFSHGEATKYDVEVPDDFELGEVENRELDEYLSMRFKGEFTMAGIRFWPEMKGLDEAFIKKAGRYRQIVPVFTNVIFDTSQVYANVSFSDMFEWLDMTMNIARESPDTLFVVRAHPDESRPGKASREPVGEWLKERGWLELKNVETIGPDEYLSSYDLISRSKLSLVYNSSIGLEAAMLGTPVVSGGLTRYHSSGAVIFPPTPEEYRKQVTDLLSRDEIPGGERRKRLARHYYYYTLFKACIDLSGFLGTGSYTSGVSITSVSDLMSENSPEIETILGGILESKPFRYHLQTTSNRIGSGCLISKESS